MMNPVFWIGFIPWIMMMLKNTQNCMLLHFSKYFFLHDVVPTNQLIGNQTKLWFSYINWDFVNHMVAIMHRVVKTLCTSHNQKVAKKLFSNDNWFLCNAKYWLLLISFCDIIFFFVMTIFFFAVTTFFLSVLVSYLVPLRSASLHSFHFGNWPKPKKKNCHCKKKNYRNKKKIITEKISNNQYFALQKINYP